MKRVFLEHLGLIAVGLVYAALVVGCSSAPVRTGAAAETKAIPAVCEQTYGAIAGPRAEIAKKSPRKRGK